MKKIIIALATCILLTGCNKEHVPFDDGPTNTVKYYIEAASQTKWETVEPILSGEALQEMQAGRDRVKETQKVIKVHTDTEIQTDNYAVVKADVFKSNNFGDARYNDFASYEFRLQKDGKQWLIYKVTPGELKPNQLKNGTIPLAVKEKLQTYLELPLADKKEKAHLYLAGPTLINSQKNNSQLPNIEPKIKVHEITPIGVTDNYLVAKAIYSVQMDGYKPMIITAIADMADVAGEWKIVRLDIAQNAKE